MKYELAIFDFDGTLGDTGAWMFTAINRAATQFGFPQTTVAEIEALRSLPTREIVRRLGIPFWKLPRIAMYLRRLASENDGAMPLFPGTIPMLEQLAKNGIRLAIVSSNSEVNIRKALGAESAGMISHYECGASMFGKAAKFRRVVEHSGVAAAHAIAIGDESRDIDAAKEAGIAAGAVFWGYATATLLQSCEPTEIFAEFEEIPRCLLDHE